MYREISNSITSEKQLAAVCFALLRRSKRISEAERKCIPPGLVVSKKLVTNIRQSISRGFDPLGDAFCVIRSSETRRQHGATYTPPAIVDAMLSWAAAEAATPVRIVDPGAGSGRFILAAAKLFPKSQLVAVEIDPLSALMLRANAAVLGLDKRLAITLTDYRTLVLPDIDGPTLFIGNPPYVRHHNISAQWKSWFADASRGLGYSASGLAGLHIHFFVRTRQIARPGDFGAFITAAEWMDVNYGSVLRSMLADGLGGTAIHLIDANARPFADAMTTAAIACFRVGNRPSQFTIRKIESLDKLAPLSDGRPVEWSEIKTTPRWSIFTRECRSPGRDEIELGEFFRVHRGQVTGCNAAWIVGPEASKIPARFLFSAITRARDLLAAGTVLDNAGFLRKVIDLPVELDELSSAERREVQSFLEWARSLQADLSFVAKHRRAWWSVGLREAAPILCTYMARRPPAFVRNRIGARHLNIAHGLYPREPISDEALDAIVRHLCATVSTSEGRTYAGGLVKFEPGEVARLHIPSPADIGLRA